MVVGSILATYYALRERILKLENEVKSLSAKISDEDNKIVELRKEIKERFDSRKNRISELESRIFERLDALVVAIHKIQIRLARNETRPKNKDPQHDND